MTPTDNKIISAPPKYLMVTIHPPVPSRDGRHTKLQEYDILDLKELFHVDSAIYGLHCAVVFRDRHYTTYIHDSDVYISDLQSRLASGTDKAIVSNFASNLFYHLIPITKENAQDSEKKDSEYEKIPEISLNLTESDSPPPSMVDGPVIPDSVNTITVSSAFNVELLRIKKMIRTKSIWGSYPLEYSYEYS